MHRHLVWRAGQGRGGQSLVAALAAETWSGVLRSGGRGLPTRRGPQAIPVSLRVLLLGGLLGGGGATAPAAPTSGFLTFGGPRAAGGPVGPSRAYLVGEEGPELFAPGIAGTIVPSARLAAATGPVITQHFTIDARGADAGVETRLRAMVPQIIAAARDGTLDAIRRGGYAYRTTRG